MAIANIKLFFFVVLKYNVNEHEIDPSTRATYSEFTCGGSGGGGGGASKSGNRSFYCRF